MTEGSSNTPKDAREFSSTPRIDVSPIEYVVTRDDLRFGLRHEVLTTGKPTVTIVGSFRFKDRIDQIIGQFEQNGINVLAPGKGRVTTIVQGGFPLLEIDNQAADPRDIEEDFLMKAACSDAVYMVDVEGYAGMDSAMERGFLHGTGTPVYSLEPLDENVSEGDRIWGAMCDITKQKSVQEMIDMLKSGDFDVEDMSWYKPWNPRNKMKRVEWYRLLLPDYVNRIPTKLRDEARRRVKSDSSISEDLRPFLDLGE